MNMTHTPGPWRATFAYDDPAVVDQDGRLVAMAVWDGEAMPEPDVFAANARLIAAAPELLVQLKMAADFISGHNECLSEPSGSGDREWYAYCIGLLDDCKSAIAKAEGRNE